MANQVDSIWLLVPELEDYCIAQVEKGLSPSNIATLASAHFKVSVTENMVYHRMKRTGVKAKGTPYEERRKRVEEVLAKVPKQLREDLRATLLGESSLLKGELEKEAVQKKEDRFRVPNPMRAPLRYPAIREDGKPYRVVFISDLHVPFHDVAAVQAITEMCQRTNPDLMIFGGDIWDASALCKYPVQHRREDRSRDLGQEIQESQPFLQQWIDNCGETVYVGGNHDLDRKDRVMANEGKGLPFETNTIWHYTDFFGIKNLKFAEFDEFKGELLKVGTGKNDVGFMHGVIYPTHTAFKNLTTEFPGQNTCQGHTHRPEIKYWKDREAVVGGHLMAQQQYQRNPKWREGFVVYDFYDQGASHTPQFIPVQPDGSFSIDKTIYGWLKTTTPPAAKKATLKPKKNTKSKKA